MILRFSSNGQRLALIAAAGVLTLLFAYLSVRDALAAHYASLETADGSERAVKLEPGDAQNWHLQGRFWQYNMDDPDATKAIHSYQVALSLDPRSAETWLDLGAALESEGNLPDARDAFERAKKAYPLSADVNWQYGNFLLRQGEMEPAFAQMRQAVQADPRRAVEAVSRPLRAGVDIETILDRVLPPIPAAYLDVIRDQTTEQQTDLALKVWDRMAALRPKITLPDSFRMVDALMASKRIEEANRVWKQAVDFAGLSDLSGPSGSVIWDGGFESEVLNGGFSWHISEGSAGVQVGIDKQEKYSGKNSLRLLFEGRSNVNYNGVCTYAVVAPLTPYVFSAWIKARDLSSEQGIRFQLQSLDSQSTATANTSEIHGTTPWTQVQMEWSPAKGVQEVRVCIARFPSEDPLSRIHGTAWVDDVALVPQAPEQTKP
jgi:carbohydrate binding protein with CBM4/9 domain/tetratricopeptide repeat protein